MTLILAFANREIAVLLADRRISSNGRLIDDEYNKLVVLCCHDARVALAFTGLAQMANLDIATWLTNTVGEIDGAGIRTLADVLECLRERLELLFRSLPGGHGPAAQ